MTSGWKVFTIKRIGRNRKMIKTKMYKDFDRDSSSVMKTKARPGRWEPAVSRTVMKITLEFQAEPDAVRVMSRP